jgi:dipeptidase D
LKKACPVLLAKIDGGNLHNAIAREANAVAGIPWDDKETAIVWANVLQANLSSELAYIDKNVSFSIHSTSTPIHCIDIRTGSKLLDALYTLPHGVIGWSFDMPGTVETSTNLASVKMKEGNQIVVTTSQRSSTNSLKMDIAFQVNAVFDLAGATVNASDGYPGWKPNPESPVLRISETIFKKLFLEEAKIISIHAGLECGLFLEKNPRLDMISCGPTILGAHSPEERLEIPTVEKWWKFLTELLKEIPAK